ncbi:MAG: caspase family protein [Hyphomicrobiaceae bacterium]
MFWIASARTSQRAWSAIALVIMAFSVTVFAAAAQARNVALVIGNNRYDHLDDLRNPRRDAAALSDRLRTLGFAVTEAFDADAFALRRAIGVFMKSAKGADLAMVYFAGHGVQLFDRNFLLARDVNPLKARTADELGIDLTAFLARLRGAGAVRVALLIDACRDNPLGFDATVKLMQRLQGNAQQPASQLARSVRRSGLANMALPARATSAGEGAETLIFFAAQPGAPSFDGSGQNSYFMEGLKEELANASRPLSETFRRVSAYVRTVTDGQQVPQVVSDWTEDVSLGRRKRVKVDYHVTSSAPGRTLTQAERSLIVRASGAYSRFQGDFLVKASDGGTENYDVTEAEKKRANKLGHRNGFSIIYDLDRDGRDEKLQVYVRQVNYVMVVQKEGVRVEANTCWGDEEVTAVEVALRDLDGDRKPEIWVAYDTGNGWSRMCILAFRGVPALSARRRGNTGLSYAGSGMFRTLLTGHAGWRVTVANDNSMKACAGSNCHSPAVYRYDGGRFTVVRSILGDRVIGEPFQDENDRASILYAKMSKATRTAKLGRFAAQSSADGKTVTVLAPLRGRSRNIRVGYECVRSAADDIQESFVVRNPTAKGARRAKVIPDLAYTENLPLTSPTLDNRVCNVRSIGGYAQNGRIWLYLTPRDARSCIARIARARLLTLPLGLGETGLLRLNLKSAGNAELIGKARRACLSGRPMRARARVSSDREGAAGAAPAARITGFVRAFLAEELGTTKGRINRVYAARVEYYGKARSRDQIAADKLRYYARWPERSYRLDPASLQLTSRGGGIYSARFEYAFEVRNATSTRSGRGETSLVLQVTDDHIVIRSENGKVLKRR